MIDVTLIVAHASSIHEREKQEENLRDTYTRKAMKLLQRFYIQSKKLILGSGQNISNVRELRSPLSTDKSGFSSPRALPLSLKFLTRRTQSGETRVHDRSSSLTRFGRLYGTVVSHRGGGRGFSYPPRLREVMRGPRT